MGDRPLDLLGIGAGKFIYTTRKTHKNPSGYCVGITNKGKILAPLVGGASIFTSLLVFEVLSPSSNFKKTFEFISAVGSN
jgi:hypothetical protein